MAMLPLSAVAENTASVTVVLTDSESETPIRGADVTLYKIASFADVDTHMLQPEPSYAALLSTMDMSTTEKSCSRENARQLLEEVRRAGVSRDAAAVSDENGQVTFEGLSEGLWLVDVAVDAPYSVDAFLLELPLWEDGAYSDHVVASPKVGENTDGTTTTVTTTSAPPEERLPQTGQVKWPIPVLSLLGVSCIVVGYADCCFSDKSKSKS